MKKRSLKKMELRKIAISNLQGHSEIDKIRGGQTIPTNNTFTDCFRNSNACGISEYTSCYSPCGSNHGTLGCRNMA